MAKRKVNSSTMTVMIRGKSYSSVKVAARVFGVKPNTIYAALARNRADMVGTGLGKSPRKRNPTIEPKEIKLAGMVFPSYMALSKWLGRSDKYVSNKLKKYPDALEQLTQEVVSRCMIIEADKTRKAYIEHNSRMNEGLGA